MIRSFKYFTIQLGGTPQPLVGTWITAAVSAGSFMSVPVNDSSMFLLGDWVLIQEVGGTLAERQQVKKIADATHITVNLANAHAGGVFGTGAFVSLAGAMNAVYVQTKDGNAGTIFVGNARNMVKATGANVTAELMKVAIGTQPVDWEDDRHGAVNAGDMSNVWIDGTTADSYLPSFGVI